MGLLTKIFGGGDGSAPSTERTPDKSSAKEQAAKEQALKEQGLKENGVNGAAHARPSSPVERKSGPVPRSYEPTVAPKNSPVAAEGLRRRPLIGEPSDLTARDFLAPAGRSPSMTLPLGLSVDAIARFDSLPQYRPSESRPSEPVEILPPRMESDIVALREPEPAPVAPVEESVEAAPAADLGDQVSRPLELIVDLAFRLSLGQVSEDWLSAGAAAAHALKLASRGGWQPHLLASFEGLERLLAEGARIRALPMLWRLSDSVPEWPAPARGLRDSARARERRIVGELLGGVDGLRSRARRQFVQDKTLAHLNGSTAELLASELEAPIERAQQLAALVASYEAQRRAAPIDVGHQSALREAVLALDRHQRKFEASDEASRAVRQERREAVRRVNLLLAERGDLALLDELEPLAVAERVERLSAMIGLGAGERA